MLSVFSQLTYHQSKRLKLIKEVKYVELESSTLEDLQVRKQELKKEEINSLHKIFKNDVNLTSFFFALN
ncbi:hypothetical protein T190611E02C_20007 [Tenacibaculum sp. 190524A05c]